MYMSMGPSVQAKAGTPKEFPKQPTLTQSQLRQVEAHVRARQAPAEPSRK